ncbi:hypothetical protein OG763_00580 [Streptomyces sp. NBC_01230]|nr:MULTISPECIES: hypothetical protein [unclassified Streptomyces]MDX3772170.1 hypothetical protein [Streptomyces sp. AK08-01B]MDX3821717.1 hypothetical protein [Streptomyces sp. AK08-01A]WSQ24491.1 hypothetical protein OG763_00580 [Streptomyces sp. NBC_01230]
MGELYGDDRGQALVDGFGGDVLVVCGYLPLTARVMVDEVCERGTEALFVGAALMGSGAVREGAELSRGPGVPLHGDLLKIVLSSFSDSKPMAGEWTRLGG